MGTLARARALGAPALLALACLVGPAAAAGEDPPPPPASAILSAPEALTNNPDASLTYTAIPSEDAVSFQCHLDSNVASFPPATPPGELEWEPCDTQPKTYPALPEGFHRFWVRAKGENPAWGDPASRAWALDTTVPQTTITAVPQSPNSGFAVSFAFASSEPNSSFRCQLDDGAIQVCANNAKSGAKTYFDLIDGAHSFRVWAKDNAGNEDPSPAEHSFEVRRFLGDTTPPDTQILISPPDPSPRADAFFAFGSSEPNSTFQCRLAPAPFEPCSEQGKGYGPLPNAPYTFEVRAIDEAGNVDSIPAAHTWRVAAPVPDTRITKAPGAAIRSPQGRPLRVAFAFSADKPGSSFRCRLDLSGPYRPCSSPHSFKAKPGRHVFEVFAVDSLGNEEGTPAFRIFRIAAPGAEQAFFARKGKLLSSLNATIAPSALPRKGIRPVSLRLGATFENLDGSDIAQLRTMALKLAKGGRLETRGLPRCTRPRLAQRTSRSALAACGAAKVGEGTVATAIRFPEGARKRASARLLLFNAGPRQLLMHVYATEPLEGVFVVPIAVRPAKGLFGNELRATFPRIAAGFGRVTGFQMKLERSYRHRGAKRSYLLGGCPAPRGLNRIAFELARVEFTLQGGTRIENSSINACRAVGG